MICLVLLAICAFCFLEFQFVLFARQLSKALVRILKAVLCNRVEYLRLEIHRYISKLNPLNTSCIPSFQPQWIRQRRYWRVSRSESRSHSEKIASTSLSSFILLFSLPILLKSNTQCRLDGITGVWQIIEGSSKELIEFFCFFLFSNCVKIEFYSFNNYFQFRRIYHQKDIAMKELIDINFDSKSLLSSHQLIFHFLS